MSMSQDPATGLPGLPGASLTAGSGLVVAPLLTGLLDDAAALGADADVARALAEHREHRAGRGHDLLGTLLVPARAVEEVRTRLEPRDRALQIVLIGTAPEPLPELREAVSALAGDDRIEIAGVLAPLPAGEAGSAARETLAALTFSVPAWIDVSGTPQWQAALDVLAADGAENAAFRVAGPRPGQIADDQDVAQFLRDAVDRDLQFTMTGGLCHAVRGRDPDTAAEHHGVLNLLCAVRAALNGAEVAEVREVITEERPQPLASAARRMSDADAAVVRAFLGSVACGSIATTVDELGSLGLYPQ